MKPSLLIVDDDEVMRETLSDVLRKKGYEVFVAPSGNDALSAIRKNIIDLIVLDMRLPDLDGLEVLKEAKEARPQLKGIIITAYPSVQTAVDAMKEGAVDYLSKPFDLNKLEELIRQTLGPVQVAIKPRAAAVMPVPVPVDKPVVEEVITIAAEEVPAHLKQGKAHFESGRYAEALKEFGAVLAVAPGSIEARVWLRKAKDVLAAPQTETAEGGAPVVKEAKAKDCLWVRMGMVAQRICTNDYNCIACEFDQMMQ